MVISNKTDQINAEITKMKRIMKLSGSAEQIQTAADRVQELYQEKISVGRKEPKVVYKKNAHTVGERMERALYTNTTPRMKDNSYSL